ncbi:MULTISPECIES: 2-amino-4-hydroxy-6-hydroxymethyldihydropteridine diphosphokinase [Pseudomonas]|jgi:2-amino-4-hydroxy-6-hydroxymethyldihydropteridine diphosphokinase|uniref:2-amino-4-hydroxy-6-hydroxymethyldihydropteridine pyrophosphokinase n=1 Tax=Pseudomonas kielensis TaxID=2762577 RepID=A0A7X1KZQ9_9PSED|nr:MULTISPECIES: 2-amino-4-hydroxy-6-hydroxymethyldihydropteridine diphosphokinase [Pseudomonas]MBC2692111.1 2-amino-4-hydroxy-6-hydroxymethyldihydropteridine diphosphokinase [Pseudomonas kielensis]NBB36514.1 2-amino-4-hydroxy-6-hydroxymethyldihydropteridine diphosphokinase [Pseudomonas sp. BC115LW]UZM12295.1 2-amino-4-hydroxy-6-hydroxymethyldihydropteridine diphosphokinase [Pseudomonas kielensis]WKL50706.1 2-amino-4-hydroxy-6-hydroxymethyldihydropteridine diphosphokinase [Pseudomonas kielensis
MERIYIGMGSNLAAPQEQLRNAVQALTQLPKTQLTGVSAFYQSDSLLPGQPRYTNAVAALESALTPLELLDALQAIENQQGRERLERWGPRTLDLDILLFGDRLIDEPRLKVPHYQMQERAFVLYPLAELAPAQLELADGRRLSDLLAACPFVGLDRLATGD